MSCAQSRVREPTSAGTVIADAEWKREQRRGELSAWTRRGALNKSVTCSWSTVARPEKGRSRKEGGMAVGAVVKSCTGWR